ncbi:hypothetical protein ACFLU6_11280 [Acidobacteriota bacterium]
MPKYQIYFDTEAGWQNFTVDIDDDEVLDDVLPDILSELEENGYIMAGWKEGTGNLTVTWEGYEVSMRESLPEQGVRSNDIIRVSVKTKLTLQLRRDREVYDIESRAELYDGDEILLGRTILQFHIRDKEKHFSRDKTYFKNVQSGKSFKQTVYFMALVGAIAGLLTWLCVTWIPFFYTYTFWLDIVNYTVLGFFIGGLSVAFNDRWLGDKIIPRWVMVGALIGALTGFAGGLLSIAIRDIGVEWLVRVLSWMFTGALIGFGICLRWISVNKNRVNHGLMGGLAGGLLGGVSFWIFYSWLGGDYSQAFGFVLTGLGITLGISLAPILLRQGVLAYVNSGDHRVNRKFHKTGKQWEIHDGGKYLIGSLTAIGSRSVFIPEVTIFIPDGAIAGKHAILTSKSKKYYIAPHPDLIQQQRSPVGLTRDSRR